MEQTQVINFQAHPGQMRVLQSKKRFIFALAGQRGGKTMIGAYWAYLQAQKPNTIGLIVANTIDQLNMSTLSKFFEEFPQLRKYYITRDKVFRLPNSSTIYCRSMEIPDNIKGMNCDWIWADEIDGMSKYAWEVMRSRTATTNGQILGTSSIYANSWLTDYVQFKKDEDYEIITWPSKLNPAFPIEEYEKLKKEMDPVDFAREYGGEFSFAGGKVYAKILEYGLINYVPENSRPLATFFGVDFGINDPTAIMVMTYNDDGCWYIIDEYYKPQMSIQDINYWIESFMKKHGRPMLTVIDPAGGVARLSLPPQCNSFDATKKLETRIFLFRDLIYQQRVYCLKRNVNCIREFQTYSFDPKHTEKVEDKNNHALDAVGMVLENCHKMVENMKVKKEEPSPLNNLWANKLDNAGNFKSFEEFFE